ncbi:S9 family peptidase [Sphingomonas ginkgonis]|uniref:S9 family peptidase n=1 Tax=Sphingomonas ginkgonis TaxID=2315330 RepID=A0A429VC04_9SPHN|nr:S9 family peptidase [Sphingomonas ginkgonis]RST31421.1 S9 family peptidase [Sphingomonas ginkgonis]
MRHLFAAASLAALTIAAPACAAPTLHQFGGLAMSPTGDRLATIENDLTSDSPTAPHARILIRSATSGAILSAIDPCAKCSYSGLAFSRDGRLAFLARDGAETRLMTAPVRGATATLATINGIAQEPRWSPDGSRIALLATVGARKEAGATQAGVRQVGEIGEQNDEQRIALVPASGGAPAFVSPADRYVYEYDWLPDASGFVVTSAPGNGDNNWWVATLDRVDLAGGRVTRLANPSTQLNFPRVSPDGRTVAFIGGLMSDFGSVGGDIYTVPIGGGPPRNITPGARQTFTSLDWGRSGLVASSLAGAAMQIVPVDLARGAGAPLWSSPITITAGRARFARSDDGARFAAVSQDFEHGPEILGGPVSQLRPVTRVNGDFGALTRARSVTWRRAGEDVQGWLLTPTSPAASKAPLVVNVHGGPSAAHTPNFVWQGTNAALLRAGYYLFLPNPRGSYGQGEAFTRANIRDFGGGDLDDILAGIDAAEKVAPIDDNRLGLIGHSYGGFMAMWSNTRTNRFKAIVAGAGLSNWISYYGTNGIDQWMIPFFGRSAYDDPDAYWKVSAIRTIKQAKTPTFIYVGERDIEVPPTQSIEYWHALQAMSVPTSLVIYPDEGHGIRSPEHNADLKARTLAWFGRYLGGSTR